MTWAKKEMGEDSSNNSSNDNDIKKNESKVVCFAFKAAKMTMTIKS